MKEIEQREYSLDLLKILATIMIVFHHYQQGEEVVFSHWNFFNGKFYFGWLVELFFMLSGYFMFRYVEKIQNGLSFKQFYLKRYLWGFSDAFSVGDWLSDYPMLASECDK